MGHLDSRDNNNDTIRRPMNETVIMIFSAIIYILTAPKRLVEDIVSLFKKEKK